VKPQDGKPWRRGRNVALLYSTLLLGTSYELQHKAATYGCNSQQLFSLLDFNAASM